MSDDMKDLLNLGMDFAEEAKPIKEFLDENPVAKVALDTVVRPIIDKVLSGDIKGAQALYDAANKAGSMKLARDMIRAERENSSDMENFLAQAVKILVIVGKGALVGLV
jgi:hypothetical protein